MGRHHRHLIFHAIAHIDASPPRALHIPPRRQRRTPRTQSAYVPSPLIRRYAHILRLIIGNHQDLKHACETVISIASEPLCAALRAFTGGPASAAEATVLDDAFLTASLAHIRLYVPNGCTASVLVQHARGRVEGCVLGLSARSETGRHKGGCGAERVVGG